MDVGDSNQESSLFQAFAVPSAGIDVNKTNDPIKPIHLADKDAPKNEGQKSDQPQSPENVAEHFEQFSTIPAGLHKYVSNDLIGTPLEDIDPFHKDKQTFIVVNRNKNLFRFSSSKSLWLFRPNSVPRRLAARILVHPFWRIFMILVVLFNCFTLLLQRGNKILDVPWEAIFLIIYLLEFIVNIIASGFILAKFSYLRNPWNRFDLILIIISITAICLDPQEAIFSSPPLSEFRILKICSLSLSLRRTWSIYWQSLVKMRDLLLFIFFTLFVISVMCLQLYMGILSQKCVKLPVGVKSDEVWLNFTRNSANLFYDEGGMTRACGNASGAQDCPANYVCLQGPNPNYGYTNFDTIFQSFFTVFRLVQRDFWEETMHYLLATAGPFNILVFIVLIFYISFQLCSLLWTPIALAYNYLKNEQWENDLLNDLNEIQLQSATKSKPDEANNPGCFAKFQRHVFYVIYNPFVVLFIIICILLNTLFMALDHHDMDVELDRVLRNGNYFFVSVFVIEAVLKLTALGPIQYFRDAWNTFDFIVTALGVIEMVLEGVQGISVLRAFRLLRPLRLCKVVPAFDLIMKRVRHLFSVLLNQTIIVCICIYIFAVFGCRTFGLSFVENVRMLPDEELPIWNFTDTFHSFMVVFRALCGEWVESMYDCLLVADVTSIVYFTALALIGSFVIMHSFVALILTNDDSSAFASNAPVSSESHAKQIPTNTKFNLLTFLKEQLLEPNILKIYDANKPIKNDVESQSVDVPSSTTIALSSDELDDKNHSQCQNQGNDGKNSTGTVSRANAKDTDGSGVAFNAPVATTEDDDNEDDATINKWSKIRVKALKFNENTYYQYIVLVIIFIGSIALVHTVNSFSLGLAGTSLVVELAFCIVMIIEFISKTISCGWKSYFKNIWCLIDLFNTIVPIVSLFAANQTLLILKALRPISLVSRCSGLKIIATTIARQSRMLLNSLVICASFWLIFAIMAVQMFAGKFYHCVDKNHTTLPSSLVPDREKCLANNDYEWTNSPVNFDNVIDAYLSLLQVATFKGWIRLIQDAVDSRDLDTQPIRESNIYMFNFFVVFIIFGVFISANLIIGILVKQILSTGTLSEAIKSSNKVTKQRRNQENEPNTNEFVETSSKLAAFGRTVYFDWIAFGVNAVYITVLAFDHYLISEKLAGIIHYVDFVFAILFIIETAIRLHSLRRNFLLQFWNFFDAVSVILVLIEFLMLELSAYNVISVNMLRVIRILRFTPLFLTHSPYLKLGLEALGQSKTAARDLILFLFLIIFVYALIGGVAYKQVTNISPINDKISFHGVAQGFILMLQYSTAAGWDGLYLVLLENDYSAFGAFMFLWSFLFISIMILVNLVLTIVLNFYKNACEAESESNDLCSADWNDFNEKWKVIATPENPLFINKTQLPILLGQLKNSSSLRPNATPTDESIQLLGIPTHNEHQLYYGEVLIALNKARLRQTQNAHHKK